MKTPPLFPLEIWDIIAKEAMTGPVTEDDFHPPPYDMESVKGFEEALPLFRSLVASGAKDYRNLEICSVQDIQSIESGCIK